MSASITTNGMTGRLRREGRRFVGKWAMTATGQPTDDSGVLFDDPPGTLLPTGGRDHGHKGYNLALTIEALSQGLAGHGRADGPTGWGASVYLQVMDPAAFGGAARDWRATGGPTGRPGWSASVYLQVMDPAAFGGAACPASRASRASARRSRRASASIPAPSLRSSPGPRSSKSPAPAA